MFRLKISVTHVVLVAVVALSAHLLITSKVAPELEQNAEVSLRRAAVIAEQTKRLDHFALMGKANLLASEEELYRYMTLEQRPAQYRQVKESLEEQFGLDQDDEAKDGEKGGEKEGGGDTAQDDEPPKVKKDGKKYVLTTEFIKKEKVLETLSSSVYYLRDLAKETQDRRNVEVSLLERRPAKPDLVMALDRNGIGVAALGKDRRDWYGDNIAKDYSSVMQVIKSESGRGRLDVWRWSWTEGDESGVYLVAIAPIQRWRHEKPAGVVVTGYQIHDGSAEDIQRLVAGVTTKREDAPKTVSEADIESAPEVAFFHGGRIISSTLDTSDQQKLSKRLFEKGDYLAEDNPEQLLNMEFKGDSWYAFLRFFPGQFESEQPSGLIVLSNVDEAKAPVGQVINWIYLVAVLMILIGVVAFVYFYQGFIKPVAEIEETIGEVLSGNKDAEFVLSDEDHEVFSSVAQGLNLMSAYLQGKPMPDAEEELEGWGDLIQETGGQPDGPAEEGGGDGPTIQGVQMPGPGGDDGDDDGKA